MVYAAQLNDADLNNICGTVLRVECFMCIGTSVLIRTVPYVLLRAAPYCSIPLRTGMYCAQLYRYCIPVRQGVRGEIGMDSGNTQDAVPDARAKAARRLSQIRLRLGDDLHRREGAEELMARDGALRAP